MFLDAGLSPMGPFRGTSFKWKAKCLNCKSIVEPNFFSVKNGSGCSVCAKKESAERQRRDAIALAKETLAAAGLSLIGEYVNARTTVSVQCLKCSDQFKCLVSSVKNKTVKCECEKSARKPLAEYFPDLFKEIHPTLNEGLNIRRLGTGTRQSIWWLCANGHSFKNSPASRITNMSPCPYCSGILAVENINDLKALFPILYSELSPSRFDPSKAIHPGSNNKYEWICSKNSSHKWQATVSSRVQGTGCPFCKSKRVLRGDNDFASSEPKLLKEWDFDKNPSPPDTYLRGSTKKVWWICSRDFTHSWSATISSRRKGSGCPICQNQKLLVGFNDLATLHPELVPLWSQQLNGDLSPRDLLGAPNRKVWWQCQNDKSHTWQSPPNRMVTQGSGCPVCSNRKIQAGANDIATLSPDLLKEWAYDLNTAEPQEIGPGSHVKVWWRCKVKETHVWKISPGNRVSGSGCPVCSGRQVEVGFNDLASGYPTIAEEWDFEKNRDLLPSMVTQHSSQSVYWKCIRDSRHSWKAVVNSRTRGNGCPVCSGHLIKSGINDLSSVNPALAEQWHPELNQTLLPTEVSPGSTQKVWWVCVKSSDHLWQASISSRHRIGAGCPVCANLKVIPGFNDLATTKPDLVIDWHASLNTDVKPSEIVAGTNRSVWWQCPSVKSHVWRASVKSRAAGRGCPDCSPTGYSTTQKGILYFIFHPELRARKIGVTNSILGAGRLKRFAEKGWTVLEVWDSEHGIVPLAAETRLLRWIRLDIGLPPYLSRDEMPGTGGWSETFSAEGVSNDEVRNKCRDVFLEELASFQESIADKRTYSTNTL